MAAVRCAKRDSLTNVRLVSAALAVGAILLIQGMASTPCRAIPDREFPYVLESEISFNPRDVEIVPVDGYHLIRLQGTFPDQMLEHVGQPQLPVKVAWFLLPPGKILQSFEIETPLSITLPGQFRPFPIPSLNDNTATPPPEPSWDAIVYPEKTGWVVHSGQARRYRLAKLALFPLAYDAVTEQLMLHLTLRARLILRDSSPEETAGRFTIQRPEWADDPFLERRTWIARTAMNPDDLDWFYPAYPLSGSDEPNKRSAYGSFISEYPSLEGLAVPYVIITNNRDEAGNYIGEMDDAFAQFAQELRPLVAAVRTIEAIESNPRYDGFDRPARIRNFIQDAVGH